MFYQYLEQSLSAFGGLQIPFGKPETHCSVSQLLTLTGQLAVWPAEDFKYINLVANSMALMNDLIKFMGNLVNQLVEHSSFTVGLMCNMASMIFVPVGITSMEGLSPAGALIYWGSVAGWMVSSIRRI
jgi:hypothetical protein